MNNSTMLIWGAGEQMDAELRGRNSFEEEKFVKAQIEGSAKSDIKKQGAISGQTENSVGLGAPVAFALRPQPSGRARGVIRLFTDPGYFEEQRRKLLDGGGAEFALTPSEFGEEAANRLYYAMLTNQEPDEVDEVEFSYWRDAIFSRGLEILPERVSSEKKLYSKIAAIAKANERRPEAESELNQMLLDAAVGDELGGRPSDFGRLHSDWLEKYPEEIRRDLRIGLEPDAVIKVGDKRRADVAKHKAMILYAKDTLTKYAEGKASDDDIYYLARSLSSLPEEDQKKIFLYVRTDADLSVVNQQTLDQFVDNLGKATILGFDFVGKTGLNLGEDRMLKHQQGLKEGRVWLTNGVPTISNLELPGDYSSVDGGTGFSFHKNGRYATAAEVKDLQAQVETILPTYKLQRDLKTILRENIAPIIPLFPDGTFVGTAERGLYGAVTSGPLMIATAVNPVAGFIGYTNESFDRLVQENPGMNRDAAWMVAALEGVLNTATDKIQIKGFPVIGKALRETKKAGILKTGLKLSQEYTEQLGQEMIQNAIEPTVETAASQFDLGMEPRSFRNEVVAFVDSLPTTASATLWLTLIGGGAFSVRDWGGGKEKTAQRLREAGVPYIEAEWIAEAKDPEEVDRRVKGAYKRLKPGPYLTFGANVDERRLGEVPEQGGGFSPEEVKSARDYELGRGGQPGMWIGGGGRLDVRQTIEGDRSRNDLVDEGTVLSAEQLNDSIHTNGRRHLRKTLRNFPLTAELDEESRAVYKTRFSSLLEQGRANSARLGVELRTLPETEEGLFYATPDESGEVKLYIHPLAAEEFLGIAKGHRGAAEQLFKDAVNEELIHAADLLADRDEWLRSPASKRGSFLKFVEQQKTARFHDLRMAREAATGRNREVIDGALVDAYRLYFEGKKEGRIIRTADGILEMLERMPSDEVNHISFVAEFTRMLLQSRDSVSEIGFLPFLEKVKAWVSRAVDRLRTGLTVAEAGDFGGLMKSRLDEIDRMMAKLPGATPGINSEGTNFPPSDPNTLLKSSESSEGQSTFSIGTHADIKGSIGDVLPTYLVSFYEKRAREEGRNLIFQSEPKAKTVEEFLKENPSKVEEIAERMRIAGLEGAEHSSVRILGETSVEKLKEEIHRTTIRLYEGASAGTVVEEVVEGRVRDAIARGQVTLEWLRSEVEGYQRASGEQLLIGTDHSVIEAVSTLGEAYFAGKVKERDLPGPLLRMFKELAEFFREVFGRGLKLQEAVKNGQVSKRFETFLKESTGLGKPNDPVLSPTGHEDWAAFTDWDEWTSGGRVKAMPVRVLNGVQMERHRGFGLEHIRQEHGQDLLRFSGGLEKFVQRVLLHFNEAYLQSSGRILLFSRKPTAVAIVELRPEKGGFYSVVSAYPKDNLSWVPAGEKIIGGRRKAFANSDSAPGKKAQTKYSWDYVKELSQNPR